MNKLFLPIVACVLAACGSDKQQALRYDVIPLPQEINLLQESPFKLTRNTVIAYPEGNALLGHNADLSRFRHKHRMLLFCFLPVKWRTGLVSVIGECTLMSADIFFQ